MNSTRQTKTETLTIKVTPEEKQMIKDIAVALDVTVSKLLYNGIFKNEKIFGQK